MENQNLTVVMYHYVRDLKHSRYPSIKGLDVALFKEQVAFLKKHYSFVTVEEVIAATQGIHKLPSHPVLTRGFLCTCKSYYSVQSIGRK